MIGTRGFFVDDDGSYTHCEITAIVDDAAGIYCFKSLDNPDEEQWGGMFEDFIPEC